MLFIISFKKNYGNCFISLFKIPHHGWYNGGRDRLNLYKINKSFQRKHFLMLPSIYDIEFYSSDTLGKLNFLRKTGRWLEIHNVFRKRKVPVISESFGGGQWWALPIDIVNRILIFHTDHPEYLKYHKYTLAPDRNLFSQYLDALKENRKF